MPSKRKAHDADKSAAAATATDPSSAVTATAAPKRQRVSRAAREKCDGVQPQCFSCVTLSRQCTYNVAPKKRGVQTGLIRTLELALVWLFDQVPETEEKLAGLLAQEGGSGQSLLLDKDSDAGNRLHKRWRRCRVHKDIDRLLSGKDGVSPRQDTSGDDSEAEADGRSKPNGETPRHRTDTSPQPAATDRKPDAAPTEPSPRQRHGSTSRRRFKLPRNYARLLDVYYSYTHSWLPILNPKEALDDAAASYPPDGLDIDPEDATTSAAHAELWCALAVGAFQNSTSLHNPGGSETLDRPSLILAAARSLIPVESEMALGHVKALLVLSLVKLGQDSAGAASLLIGLAVRGAMALTDGQARDRQRSSISGRSASSVQEPYSNALDRVLKACLMLDTIVSLRLGQTPHMRTGDMKEKPTEETGSEEWAPWVPRAGFGSGSETPAGAVQPAQSLSSFNQLYQFFRTLNQSVESGVTGPKVGAANLVQVLDPRFSFCNSVVFGVSTIPILPSAFLIQATFLSATLTLMADARVSLIWGLMEVLESSISHFGAAGVSPILVTYMSIASTQSCVQALRGHDKTRWDSLMADLMSVWQDRTATMAYSPMDAEPSDRTPTRIDSVASQFSRQASSVRPNAHYPFPMNSDSYHSSGGGFLQTASSASPSTARTMPFTPGSQLDTFPSGFIGHLPSAQAPYLMGQGSHGVDYDAIMDELASIDCTDSMEADPQFMANLGFAPGSDLTDMLRGEYGGM